MSDSSSPGASETSLALRSLLLTDLVDSTQLVERLGDARAAEVFGRHDRLARDLLARFAGREIDKTDGFLVLFERPADAVRHALAYHEGLETLSEDLGILLRARAGIHLGEVHLRPNAPEDVARGAKLVEVEGLAKPTAARLMSLALPGQTLLTSAAHGIARRSMVGEEQAATLAWIAHGPYSFKGVEDPIEVFEVGVAGRSPLAAPADSDKARRVVAPEAASAATRASAAGNLPRQLTGFVGRSRETADVARLLERARLVTLTGPGGGGKTRLALEVARHAAATHPCPAWLVDLATVVDAALVPQTVAQALAIEDEPGRTTEESLASALESGHALVILDGCERQVSACASLAERLLRNCPDVRLLVTSREPLGIGSETVFAVPPLGLPDPARGAVESVLASDAGRFFLDRVAAARPGFDLTSDNAAAVSELCRRLDGIPLALELAAARVRAMSVAQVVARLDDCFRLLAGGSRTALARHQTIRATIDWSFEQLDDVERTLLRRLAIFAGGFTLEAVEATCPGGCLDVLDILDLLPRLVDKSLVTYEGQRDPPRYRLLEIVRIYARGKLQEAGEEAELRARHLAHFLALADDAGASASSAAARTWGASMEVEHENLRAGLASGLALEGCAPSGLRLAVALGPFWRARGRFSEGRRHLAEALARNADAPDPLRARALNWAGTLAWSQSDHAAARAAFDETVTLRRQAGDVSGTAAALNNLGLVAAAGGDHVAARRLMTESLELLRGVGDRSRVAGALVNLGLVARELGDLATARALCRESLEVSEELRSEAGIAWALHELGVIARLAGDADTARAHLSRSLCTWRELGDRQWVAWCLNNLGAVASAEGDQVAARKLVEEALALLRELGDKRGIAAALDELAEVALEEGNLEEARELASEAVTTGRPLGHALDLAGWLTSLGLVEAARGHHAAARSHVAEGLEIRSRLAHRAGIAASLEASAVVAATGGDATRAARLLGASEGAQEALGVEARGGTRASSRRAADGARASLGEAEFAAAWSAGRSMSLEAAIGEAMAS